MNSKKQKVFVGLSGGVDSSVSAALLQRAGYDVTGVFIKVWSPDWLPCTWREERRDAMRVAAHLNIPFLTFDFEDIYKHAVVDYLLAEYQRGRTPNPDVLCNKEVKFGAFFKEARRRGADYIATGHYAQNLYKNGKHHLFESIDKEKDQSYFLWTISQGTLQRVLFPVGNLHKRQVRDLAKKFNLPTAAKKDSQGICFLGQIDMKEFLAHYISPQRGIVLDTRGHAIGWHPGALFFTLGERHGFTITDQNARHEPHYVSAKDMIHNTITVAPHQVQVPDTAISQVHLETPHWISGEAPVTDTTYAARWRYRQQTTPCRITIDTRTNIFFETPQKHIPPGQSLVLYKDSECLGGGILL